MQLRNYLEKRFGGGESEADNLYECMSIIHDSIAQSNKSGGKILESKDFDQSLILVYLMKDKLGKYYVYILAQPPVEPSEDWIHYYREYDKAKILYDETIDFIEKCLESGDDFPYDTEDY